MYMTSLITYVLLTGSRQVSIYSYILLIPTCDY